MSQDYIPVKKPDAFDLDQNWNSNSHKKLIGDANTTISKDDQNLIDKHRQEFEDKFGEFMEIA